MHRNDILNEVLDLIRSYPDAYQFQDCRSVYQHYQHALNSLANRIEAMKDIVPVWRISALPNASSDDQVSNPLNLDHYDFSSEKSAHEARQHMSGYQSISMPYRIVEGR